MAYIGTSPQNGVRNRFVYAATQGQTAFTGADSDGKTLAISDQLYTDVYQNGVKLKLTTDWTASSTTVTLVNAASVSDVIEILSFDVFSVSDTVPASTGGAFAGGITATTGTFSGAVTVTGEVSASSGSFLKQQDPTILAYKDLDATGHHNIGSFTIDERGRYRIGWDFRMGWTTQSGYLRTYLGTSSAGGQVGNSRMVIENMSGSGSNANFTFQQVMDFGTSLSYPYTVYVNAYNSSAGSGGLFNQSDVNGYPVVSCCKVSDIATSTGMVVFGS